MTLLNDFYEILSLESSSEGFSYKLRLQNEHIIYQGHFPGFPVTPGVIQLQIVHELLEFYLEKKVVLESLTDCKFLHILDPRKTTELDLEIKIVQKENLLIHVTGITEGGPFLKLRGNYVSK